MPITAQASVRSGQSTAASLTLFVCSNCSRPAAKGTAARPPVLPEFQWPFSVQQVSVPCAGRVQPEYILKALEAGADAVCVVACDDDNCHYTEGCRRAVRRVEYVQGLLGELGLEKQRVILQQLPGSAREDLGLNEPGCRCEPPAAAGVDQRVAGVRQTVVAALAALGPSPLRDTTPAEAPAAGGQPAEQDAAASSELTDEEDDLG